MSRVESLRPPEHMNCGAQRAWSCLVAPLLHASIKTRQDQKNRSATFCSISTIGHSFKSVDYKGLKPSEAVAIYCHVRSFDDRYAYLVYTSWKNQRKKDSALYVQN